MSRTPIRLLVLLAASLTAIALAVPAQAAAPYCGITWGSPSAKGRRDRSRRGQTLTDVRAGRHDCYDRLVIDLDGSRVPLLERRVRRPRARRTRPAPGAPPRAARPADRRRSTGSPGTRRATCPGQPPTTGERHRLPHLPPGRAWPARSRAHHARAGRPGPAAVPGLHARPVRAPVASSSTSRTAGRPTGRRPAGSAPRGAVRPVVVRPRRLDRPRRACAACRAGPPPGRAARTARPGCRGRPSTCGRRGRSCGGIRLRCVLIERTRKTTAISSSTISSRPSGPDLPTSSGSWSPAAASRSRAHRTPTSLRIPVNRSSSGSGDVDQGPGQLVVLGRPDLLLRVDRAGEPAALRDRSASRARSAPRRGPAKYSAHGTRVVTRWEMSCAGSQFASHSVYGDSAPVARMASCSAFVRGSVKLMW